jgi:penicillin-binding protein 2
MKRLFKQESLVGGHRLVGAHVFVLVVLIVLTLRLWQVQILRGEYYSEISKKNRIRRIEIPAARGMIYDRDGKLMLANQPYFDLVFVPQFVNDTETSLRILSRLIHVPMNRLRRSLRQAQGRPAYLPITIKRNLSSHEVAIIETNKIFLPGVDILPVPRRDYPPDIASHLVGYLAEIDPLTLKKSEKDPGIDPYQQGDLIGKQGVEASFEKHLRGKSGYRLIQVDAFGRKTQPHLEGMTLPVIDAQKGHDVELTIDIDVQEAARRAFMGKQGAIVVVAPKTGEILALISSPGFDPALYQKQMSQDEWYAIINNPFKPLLDKTTGGEFIPGSVFKPLIGLAALQEGITTPMRTIRCHGSFQLGNDLFHCWERQGHGIVDLEKAIARSCDSYFYQIGIELGIDKITEYALDFGLGKRLGLGLNMERPGLVPSREWKRKNVGSSWQGGDTPNVAIGQGYVSMTPLQMAMLYASIATDGKMMKPRLLRQITNSIGEVVETGPNEVFHQSAKISAQNFKLMRRYLQSVVMSNDGTGRNASLKNHTVAGKTGSAQVVSLKKNQNNQADDTSMLWKEHAIFTAFSPTENAEIAIAIVSENDSVGGGGAQAAPIAKQILEAYWQKKSIKQPRLSKQQESPKL